LQAQAWDCTVLPTATFGTAAGEWNYAKEINWGGNIKADNDRNIYKLFRESLITNKYYT
jgi:hypothetical protein